MKLFRHAPLRQKLTSLTLLCNIVALVATAIALGTYEWVLYRRTIYSQLDTLSSITARNSAAALAFSNAEDANRVLSALYAEPAVVAAALYDATGEKIADYRRANITIDTPPTAPPDGRIRSGTQLDIAIPVSEAKRFGTLLVRAD